MSDISVQTKPHFLTPLADVFKDRYVIFSVISMTAAIITASLGYEAVLSDIVFASALVLLQFVIQNYRLYKYNITRKNINDNKKALDARLIGSINDTGGIGSMMSALAAVSSAFADLYITDGGLFQGDSFVIPIIASLAKALSIAAIVGIISSRNSIMCSLYLTVCRGFADSERSILKNATRVTHHPSAMKSISSACAIRLTTSISISIAIVIASLSGSGAPYSCTALALISAAVLLISEMSPKCKNDDHTDEKLTLWSKFSKSLCLVNVIVFTVITIVFLFSFPIQSVFCHYTMRHEFNYYDNVSAEIQIFSVPSHCPENAALFTGFFVISILLIIVISAATRSETFDFIKGISAKEHFSAILICVFGTVCFSIISGYISPMSSLDSIMWVVAISIGCILTLTNLIMHLTHAYKQSK